MLLEGCAVKAWKHVLPQMSFTFRKAYNDPVDTPNPATNITSTNIAWLKHSGKSPTDLGIPPLRIKIP